MFMHGLRVQSCLKRFVSKKEVRSNGEVVAFILANTEPTRPPLVPEIRLRLASEAVPLWQATERMLEESGIEPPYWAFCWPGSQALARHVLDHPAAVAGRRVLDLAAGCGVAAIAPALAGAHATANEIDRLALAAIGLNAAMNGVAVATEPGSLLASPRLAWDLVLAGDVCYERSFAEQAVAWLRQQSGQGADVWLADPGRAYAPSSGIEPIACYQVPTSLELEDRDSRECRIWRVLP